MRRILRFFTSFRMTGVIFKYVSTCSVNSSVITADKSCHAVTEGFSPSVSTADSSLEEGAK